MKGSQEDDSSKPSALPAPEAVDERSRDWHARLKSLYEYWKSIHRPRGLPGREEFDPSAVPELLPSLWILDVQREPFRLRYRLVGTSIMCSAPGGLTGRWLDEVRPEIKDIPGYFDRHRAVVETKIPSWRRGPSRFQIDPAFASLENLFLPMAKDGQDVDMILAGTVYYRLDKTEF